MKIHRFFAATVIVCLAFSASNMTPVAHAQSVDLAGKQVRLLIGFGPGGNNDVWARVISRHMPKFLPGSPIMVPQNYPGAGGLKLINELYNTMPKDGTVIGLVSRGLAFEPLLGGANTRFDAMKINFIGSPDRDITVCAARKDAQVQTMQDLFSKTLVMGASGSGADTVVYPQFLSELLGMKFKIIQGYPGSREISIAMERNEVEGICVAYESVIRQPLAREGKLNILFQAALQSDPRLQGIPIGTDLAKSDQDRAVLKLFFARVAMGRPLVLPPDVDPALVAAFRNAFAQTMKDAEFLAEAKQLDLRIDPISGEELADVVRHAYSTPKEIVAKASEILGHMRAEPAKP